MLLLAIELSEGGEHASNFTNSERKYKHKHFHNYEKTGSTMWFLTEFRRFFLMVPRWVLYSIHTSLRRHDQSTSRPYLSHESFS